MRYRPLQELSQWAALIGIPQDEEELIRHYTLSGADIDRALIKRGEHNQLGFAVQLCLIRFPDRALGPNEVLPRMMLGFIAQQLGINPVVFADYARRDETRREHAVEIQQFLGLHTADREDRRAALIAASAAADATDSGALVAEAIVESLRAREPVISNVHGSFKVPYSLEMFLSWPLMADFDLCPEVCNHRIRP